MPPAFRRNRTFHAVIVALLGLGIGSVTLVFSLVNELLLKPLPVRNPRNLYLLELSRADYFPPTTSFRGEQYEEVVRKSPLVAAVVAEGLIAPQNLAPMREGGTTRLLMTQIVSGNY